MVDDEPEFYQALEQHRDHLLSILEDSARELSNVVDLHIPEKEKQGEEDGHEQNEEIEIPTIEADDQVSKAIGILFDIEIPEKKYFHDFRETFKKSCAVIVAVAQSLRDNEEEHDAEEIITTSLSATESMHSAIDKFTTKLNNVPGTVKQKAKNAANTVINWFDELKSNIKGIAKELWDLLSSFVNLKSWTLSGEAGSSVLGLGSVGVELHFEK